MRWTTLLAWAVWAVCVLLFAAALGSVIASAGIDTPGRPGPLDVLVFGVTILAFPTVGALVASRRPRNPLGWLFCLVALSIVIAIAAAEYVDRGLYGGADLPAIELASWLGSWAWMAGMATAVTFLPLLFPTGSPPTPRWRIVAWLSGLVIGLAVVSIAIKPGIIEDRDGVNPLGIGGSVGAVAAFIADNFAWPLALLVLASLAAFVRRFIHARGIERQQLKWIAYAMSVMALGGGILAVSGALGLADPETLDWAWYLFIGGIGLIPVAAGVAILRHRLFDIDLLINRTLVYGALTASLAALYIGSVILLQGLLSGFAGGSSLAVAASTLVVAALFQPIRRRIQRLVDRRFYRSRYDAQRTLEAFTVRLRHEVDLARLTDELAGSVEQSLQPASVSVWLRAGRSAQ